MCKEKKAKQKIERKEMNGYAHILRKRKREIKAYTNIDINTMYMYKIYRIDHDANENRLLCLHISLIRPSIDAHFVCSLHFTDIFSRHC